MTVVFSIEWENADQWMASLRHHGPELDVRTPEAVEDPGSVDAAVVFKPQPGFFARYPGLRVICSPAAGVDHLFAPGVDLPDARIVRLADPLMGERMAQFAVYAVIRHQRSFDIYDRQQARRQWIKQPFRDAADMPVGIMGMGVMGQACARALSALGYPVLGWTRSPRSIEGVETYAGSNGLDLFLERTRALVCLLPLTEDTTGIINARTLSRLPEGAVVINAGRGEHVCDADLLEALDAGRLSGATLDVFLTEPLPVDHPYWLHPKVTVLPHMASLSNPDTGAAQLVEAIRAVRAGREPANQVDRQRGY